MNPHAGRLVAAARALLSDPNNIDLRRAYIQRAFNHDLTAASIVELADSAVGLQDDTLKPISRVNIVSLGSRMIGETTIREALALPTEAERLANEAIVRRTVLFHAHRRAVEAGDTRAMNETRKALIVATANALKYGA